MNRFQSLPDQTAQRSNPGVGTCWAQNCDGCNERQATNLGRRKRRVPGMGYRMVCAKCALRLPK